MRRRLEEDIARCERAFAGGAGGAEAGFRLGRLLLQAGRPAEAVEVLERTEGLLARVVHDADGAADLHPLALEVDGLLEQARARAEGAARAARRRELLAALEAGELDAAGHDELIRLEVRDGLPLHREPPRCPACAGPMSEPRADGTVRCARSGEGGDLCRHTDAEGLYACPACGLVVRAWAEGSLPPSPHEPPLVRPERTQCPHCSGRVADWQRHVRRCPKARPVDFPRCAVCDRRGFHRASLRCPRCAAEVARTLCGEPKGPRRRR